MSPVLRLAFVTKSDPDSGNYSTAQRICEGLTAARPNWSYRIVSVADFCPETGTDQSLPAVAAAAAAEDSLLSADVLLCLHLYRCGAPLLKLQSRRLPPAIGIAGGTDLNVDSAQPDRRAAMRQFALQCRHLVVFSESMLHSLDELMGEDFGRTPVSVVPQGISSDSLLLAAAAASAAAAAAGQQLLPAGCQRYFISVGRIRPVKHCCCLLGPFSRWRDGEKEAAAPPTACRRDSVQLVFVGDIEDSSYGEEFKAQVEQLHGVHLLRGVPHGEALRLMRESLGLINSSLSEGQSNSVLEAMSLGVPVIVSAIPGNLDLVRHMETGLTFRDDEQLIQCLDTAASQDAHGRQLMCRITGAAKAFVQERHSADKELHAYTSLISECCESS